MKRVIHRMIVDLKLHRYIYLIQKWLSLNDMRITVIATKLHIKHYTQNAYNHNNGSFCHIVWSCAHSKIRVAFSLKFVSHLSNSISERKCERKTIIVIIFNMSCINIHGLTKSVLNKGEQRMPIHKNKQFEPNLFGLFNFLNDLICWLFSMFVKTKLGIVEKFTFINSNAGKKCSLQFRPVLLLQTRIARSQM